MLLAAAVLYIAGALAVALSASFATLLTGRVLLGIAVGFSSATATVYAAEVSPSDVRGAVVTLLPSRTHARPPRGAVRHVGE